MNASRDYRNDDNTPMTCGDCNTPAYYDGDDEQYHHAVNADRGCFLIAAEDRDDDRDHPLYEAYTDLSVEVLTLDRDEYGAGITTNTLGTLYRLHWTDYVANAWTEDYYSLASALTRLAALDFVRDGSKFFLTDAETFGRQAHTFLGTVVG